MVYYDILEYNWSRRNIMLYYVERVGGEMGLSVLEHYKNILDLVPCGICQVALDDNFTILYANRLYYDIYGYTAENASEKGFKSARFILPESEYPAIHQTVMGHVERGEQYFQLEYRGVHSSGSILWLLVQCSYNPDKPGAMLCALVDIAKRKQMEEELRISMEENRIAFELTDKIMYVFEVEERRLHQPKDMADEFGLPPVAENVPDSVVESEAIDESSRKDYIEFYESIIRGEPSGYAVVKKRRLNGSFCWHEARFSTIFDGEGRPARAIISCEDITEQREKELTYQKWSQYFKTQAGKTLGYYEYNLTRNTMEEGVGDEPPEYLKSLKKYTQAMGYIATHFVYEGDLERFYLFFNREKLLARYYDGQREESLEYLRKREDGSLYWVRATVQLIADPYSSDVRIFMMTLDIDCEKRENLRLHEQLELDRMTGIFNRGTFVAKVTEILEQGVDTKRHALIMLDIDEFKRHNDSYGHQFGDQVIREIAQVLQSFLRKSDLCGRMGGDEFMVFLNDISSETEVIPRISSLCGLLRERYLEKGEVTCSLGVVFYPRDGMDFNELYHNADMALYEAKRAGRANYRIYGTE